MKKAIFFFLIVFVLASSTFAQENMGARPIGMGGAFTGLADDANAIFVNPAGIGYLRGEIASVSTKISDGKEYTIIGGVEYTPFGSIGVGYVSSSSPVNNLNGSSLLNDEGETPIKTLNQTLVFSYGRELNEFMTVSESMGKLSLGANLKFSSFRINNAKGLFQVQDSKIDVDFAAVFKPSDDLSCGLSLRDLFSKAYTVVPEEMNPGSTAAIGLSGKLLNKTLTWSLEGKSLGCEWKPISELALRIGRDGEYNTAGIGINYEGFGFDYAYMGKENPVHYVSVSMARPSLNNNGRSL